MRVRNFEPSTPSRRSANSLSRLRASTNVSATKRRKINAERAKKTAISWLLPGRRNVRSKAVCETRMASKRKTAIASRIMYCLRLEVLGCRVGADCDTASRGPANAAASAGSAWDVQIIIDAWIKTPEAFGGDEFR